jgi:phosphohistidine phosphatase SixA
MQRLLIFRHAKAVPWGSTPDDFSRPLNEIGTAHAKALARWMQDNIEMPDLVLCSPSQRTRETLQPLIETAGDLERCTRFLPQVYDASVQTLINVLDHAFAEYDSVMVVGHNPGLQQIVFETIARSEADKIKRLASGTLVEIEFESDWAEAQGQGKIAHIVGGKEISS